MANISFLLCFSAFSPYTYVYKTSLFQLSLSRPFYVCSCDATFRTMQTENQRANPAVFHYYKNELHESKKILKNLSNFEKVKKLQSKEILNFLIFSKTQFEMPNRLQLSFIFSVIQLTRESALTESHIWHICTIRLDGAWPVSTKKKHAGTSSGLLELLEQHQCWRKSSIIFIDLQIFFVQSAMY